MTVQKVRRTALFLAFLLFPVTFMYMSPVMSLGGEQECMSAATFDKRLVAVRGLRWAKWLIWAAWVGAIAVFAVRAGGYHKLDLMWGNPGFPPYDRGAHLAWLGFAALPVLLYFTLGRRAFCHYLCFFSPLNIIGATVGRWLRLPRLGVHVVAADRCQACGTCAANCPSGVLRYGVGR